MGPQATSEPFQQMLNNSDGNISLQEAAQATLAGVPSAAVMGVPTVNNTLAMARFNVVNVNTGVPDAELRRELHQHEVQLSEQARQEAEFEALRCRSLCEREPQSQRFFCAVSRSNGVGRKNIAALRKLILRSKRVPRCIRWYPPTGETPSKK